MKRNEKKCWCCEKRAARYPTLIYTVAVTAKEVELCPICYKRYSKLKERFLAKAYEAMLSSLKENKND